MRDSHLWLLLNFELWARQFLDSRERDRRMSSRRRPRVVHVTTVDMSVRHLLLNQLLWLQGRGVRRGRGVGCWS